LAKRQDFFWQLYRKNFLELAAAEISGAIEKADAMRRLFLCSRRIDLHQNGFTPS